MAHIAICVMDTVSELEYLSGKFMYTMDNVFFFEKKYTTDVGEYFLQQFYTMLW